MGFGVVDQGAYLGVGERFGSGETDETILAAAALEDFVRVGESGTPVEAEANAFRVGGDGDEGGGGAVGSGETEDEELVIVVDDFDCGGETFAEDGAAGLDFLCESGVEFGEEAGDLFIGRDGRWWGIGVFWPDASGFSRFFCWFGFAGGWRHW